MAQTITVNGSKRGANGGLDLTIALAADAYVNGTGLSVNITSKLHGAPGIPWGDITHILGNSNTGHSVYITKSATAGVLNVRLFNGTAEAATGNVTTTIKCTAQVRPRY